MVYRTELLETGQCSLGYPGGVPEELIEPTVLHLRIQYEPGVDGADPAWQRSKDLGFMARVFLNFQEDVLLKDTRQLGVRKLFQERERDAREARVEAVRRHGTRPRGLAGHPNHMRSVPHLG
jgi:hypothetical protein